MGNKFAKSYEEAMSLENVEKIVILFNMPFNGRFPVDPDMGKDLRNFVGLFTTNGTCYHYKSSSPKNCLQIADYLEGEKIYYDYNKGYANLLGKLTYKFIRVSYVDIIVKFSSYIKVSESDIDITQRLMDIYWKKIKN
jgi:hypothetical protein